MPVASVVITTYNRSHLLPRAIESAQNAGADLEVIVVDDASTDDTPELCSRLSNIRYVRLPTNGGLARARNVGITESSGEYISFLDDDDLRLPGSIDQQLRILENTPDSAFCYAQVLLSDAQTQLLTGQLYPSCCPQGDVFWQLLEYNFIPVLSVLARKSSLLAVGCFNPELKLVEDWDMWLRLSEVFPATAIRAPVAIHRKATAISDQMCSNSSDLCLYSLQVQQLALNRTRAQTGTRAQRRQVRKKLLKGSFELLMTEARAAIKERNARAATARVWQAFRFCSWPNSNKNGASN
ncbi:MAG: glycosyltransferase family 2 protein [Pyrinomonadaceae bacterium]